MIGPTGVGKTEIARRLAKLAQSPFLKVEASKFTEVGYVGRDVESMVRDLDRDRRGHGARGADRRSAREGAAGGRGARARSAAAAAAARPPEYDEQRRVDPRAGAADAREAARAAARRAARSQAGRDRRPREVVPVVRDHRRVVGRGSRHQRQGHAARPVPGPHAKRRVPVPEALDALRAGRRAEADRHGERRARRGRARAAGRHHLHRRDRQGRRAAKGGHGPDVSREGVQRDILPIVEGTTVNTKYGMVKTDHILFIAAGAFHVSKPSDLIPELQGRFPIRVELEALGREDFVRILTEPKNALVRAVHGAALDRGRDAALHRRTRSAASPTSPTLVNERTENIGARRLHTVMEKLLDEMSFDAPDLAEKDVTIDAAYVDRMLAEIARNEDLSRYIL